MAKRDMSRDYTIIFQSKKEFDPKLKELGTTISGSDFYAWTKSKSLIYERVGTWDNKPRKNEIEGLRGLWIFALKWSGDGFRVVTIAVEDKIMSHATKIVKENLKQGKSLSLLREYSFDLPEGTIFSNDTNLVY